MKKGYILSILLIPMFVALACSAFIPRVPVTGTQVKAPAVVVAQPTQTETAALAMPTATSTTAAADPPVQPVADKQATPSVTPTSPAANPSVPALSGDVALNQATIESVIQTVNPSVVSIQVVEPATSIGRNHFRSSGSSIALGSGFVWDTQGHIITNNHVISGATSISITFADHSSADATLVGADPNIDLAVLKVNLPAAQLQPVQMADSTLAKVGQITIAIGNPFGLNNTATLGIISGLERTLPSGLDSSGLASQNGPSYSIPDIIQTDASINPGNSGGVLVDLQGKVLGVPSAIESYTQTSAGIGFVIPAEIVKRVVPVLIQKGSYQDPWIGIDGMELNSAINKTMRLDAKQQGVLVIDVAQGSTAEQAGLTVGTDLVTVNGQDTPIGGDVITAIDGQPVSQLNELFSYLFMHTVVGDKVTLTVLRQGKSLSVPVSVGAFPSP